MNIYLRRLEYDDALSLVEIVDDSDVQKYLLLSQLPYTLSDARNFIEYTKNTSLNGGEQCFAIISDGRMAGVISYTIGSEHKSCAASIGYYVGKKYWGNGIASAAVKLMVSDIFGNPSVRRIYAEIFAQNQASARVLEKCGFACEGRLKKAIIKDGVVYDALVFALTR